MKKPNLSLVQTKEKLRRILFRTPLPPSPPLGKDDILSYYVNTNLMYPMLIDRFIARIFFKMPIIWYSDKQGIVERAIEQVLVLCLLCFT